MLNENPAITLGYLSASDILPEAARNNPKVNSNWMYDLVYDVVVKTDGELPLEKERKDELWKLSKKINASRQKSIWWDRERIYKSLLIVEYLYMKSLEGYKLDLWDEQGKLLKDVNYTWK
jgi:hypothetical protein